MCTLLAINTVYVCKIAVFKIKMATLWYSDRIFSFLLVSMSVLYLEVNSQSNNCSEFHSTPQSKPKLMLKLHYYIYNVYYIIVNYYISYNYNYYYTS